MDSAIVTGAASGMGRLYAIRLFSLGYTVLAVDKNSEALENLCRECVAEINPKMPISTDKRIIPVVVDLCSPEAVSAIEESLGKSGTKPKILINNAGMLIVNSICRSDPAQLKNIITLHCITPVLLCRSLAPLLHENDGYILNISSICAWMPWPAIGIYGNTKRFIKGFSRSLRDEMIDGRPSVTTAVFGAVDTDFFHFPSGFKRLLTLSGFMISPEKAVNKALSALFHRKKTVIPGLLVKLSLPLFVLIPDLLLKYLFRKVFPSIS